jgi:hypothetical protein
MLGILLFGHIYVFTWIEQCYTSVTIEIAKTLKSLHGSIVHYWSCVGALIKS